MRGVSAKLPISIISPVMNCAPEMMDHAAHLRRLAAGVEEIIVVDSQSTDGTPEILRRELSDLPIRWLDHPPGLYQSWNYGIQSATSKFLNVATVGDIIAPDGLSRLVESIEKFGGDVVVSPPTLVNEDGSPAEKSWPISWVLCSLGLSDAVEICAEDWFALSMGVFTSSLISSSASNLYRTSFLKRNPFPHDFGHAGDAIWALQHAFDAVWVFDPTVESTFHSHPPRAHRKPASRELELAKGRRLAALFEERETALRRHGVPEHLIAELRKVPGHPLMTRDTRARYNQIRNKFIPYFIQPEAVRLRRLRKNLRADVEVRKSMVCDYADSRYGRAAVERDRAS